MNLTTNNTNNLPFNTYNSNHFINFFSKKLFRDEHRLYIDKCLWVAEEVL